MVISSTGKTAGTVGGGIVEKDVISKASGVMKTGKPMMLDFDLSGARKDLDSICGGNMSIFLEPFGLVKSLLIMGAGHVGSAIAALASKSGFDVTLVDPRAEYIAPERLRKEIGDDVNGIAASPDDFEDRVKITDASFVVICTSGHASDREWLGAVLRKSPRYVGMLGSRNKARAIFEALEAGGTARERLDTVHTPIGLDIGAITPEEIAVSVVAELIKEWRS
ncbi:MAG: XdhC/CoxI family protein, partial [bacterium]|jgi:xanthine dehydrogenase accessory factor